MLKKAIYLTLFLFLTIGGAGCGREELNNANKVESNLNLTENGGKNETRNWLVFHNEKYGYSFLYPEKTEYCPNARETEATTFIGTNSHEGTSPEYFSSIFVDLDQCISILNIDFYSNNDKLSLIDYIKKDIDVNNKNNSLLVYDINALGQNIMISGKEAYELTFNGCCLNSVSGFGGTIKAIYIKYDENTIGVISYNVKNPDDQYSSEHYKIFEKIVSTFIFDHK